MNRTDARSFRVTSGEDAREATEYFNAFHDGFIQHLSLRSHDTFEDIGVHRVTGPVDLEIVIAHYNYGCGEPPAHRRVQACFSGVRNLRMQFTGAETDWPVTTFEMDDVNGVECKGELVARLVQPRLVDDAWSHAEALYFSFSAAVLLELPDQATRF